MSNIINLDITRTLINPEELNKYKEGLIAGHEKLWSGKEELTGWVRYPLDYDKTVVKKILDTAEKIKKQCEVFVVIGIGGSYLGAHAAITAMDPRMNGSGNNFDNGHGYNIDNDFRSDNSKQTIPEIYFAGHNLSGTYHAELIDKIKDKEICICIISKSGETTEPLIAFSIFKDFLYNKYGKEEANKRIYAITDASKGKLREETDREGYTCFTIPDDIGGRYSVLTSVGLLTISVAGIDIQEMLDGASSMALDLQTNIPHTLDCQYAATRIALLGKGKVIEIFQYYEPRLELFTEWLKQLFGESEGKQGKGIYPAAHQFSTDLHSIGQYLQEGNQIFFETILNVINPNRDIIIPEGTGRLFSGKGMNVINQAALLGTITAHNATKIPIIKIDIPKLSPYYFGQLVYFFETACALSAYLMGVNPFDQPGVESYKAEMRKVLED